MNSSLLLLTLLTSSAMAQTPSPAASVTPTPFPCPMDGSGTAIEAWRDELIAKSGTGSHFSYGGSSTDFAILKQIDTCFPKDLPACLVTLRKSLKENTRSYSLKDGDVKNTPQRQIPKELLESGSDDLNYVFKEDVEKIAKEKGWPVARYKSRHSGGFEHDTSSLLMIEVPGDKMDPPVDYDRFINIGLKADKHHDGTNPVPQEDFPSKKALKGPKSDEYPHITTMVTVKRATKETPSEIYFQMFDRTDGSAVYRPQAPSQAESCYACHSSGLRQISPLGYHVRDGEKQLPPDLWKAVDKLNTDMFTASGGKPSDWRSVLDKDGNKVQLMDPSAKGPVYGPNRPLNRVVTTKDGETVETYPTRTEQFIMGDGTKPGCANMRPTVNVRDIFGRAPGAKNIYQFTKNPPIDWKRVARSMNCQACHDNVNRGGLNSYTDPGTIDFKILVDQSMPFGSHQDPMERGSHKEHPKDNLNANERIALANCLKAEFQIEQTHSKDWLKEEKCKDEKGYVEGQFDRLIEQSPLGKYNKRGPSCIMGL